MALAAAHRCAPDALELHAIDSTASALGALAALPHLGTLANRSDGFDLAARLLARLEAELVRRRDSLAAGNAGAGAARARRRLGGTGRRGRSARRRTDGRPPARPDARRPGGRATVVVAGGRATLSARIAATAATRFVLHQHESSDYAQAGSDPRAVRHTLPPGRAIRVGDGAEVQFVFPGSGRRAARGPRPPVRRVAGRAGAATAAAPAPRDRCA